jgi:hypothetical protein
MRGSKIETSPQAVLSQLILSSSFQQILGAMEMPCHRLGLIIDRTKKKTRLDSVERGRKERE